MDIKPLSKIIPTLSLTPNKNKEIPQENNYNYTDRIINNQNNNYTKNQFILENNSNNKNNIKISELKKISKVSEKIKDNDDIIVINKKENESSLSISTNQDSRNNSGKNNLRSLNFPKEILEALVANKGQIIREMKFYDKRNNGLISRFEIARSFYKANCHPALSMNNINVYIRGHWDKELWGLCAHPKENKYFTVGEDKLLGIWDINTRKLINSCNIEKEADTIACSPDGNELAIGCKEGELIIYDINKLKKKYLIKETVRKSISDVKYNPEGNLLAVGGLDKDTDGFMHIFIYDCKNQYKLIKKLKGHQARVKHIDWSADGEFIQSDSAAYELLYHSIDSGQQITNISSLKDIDWYTWTCIFGWPVQGIWPPCSSGDDINACDVDKTKRVIVTSDDFSKVKLFRYPSPVEKAVYNQYNGHSSHVTNVRFMADNKHIISTGGNDKAIFQFKFSFDSEPEEENEYDEINEKEENPDLDEENPYFKEEELNEGDEFGASKPWLGELKHSSPNIQITKNMGNPPKENINRLKYVFGYRAFDSRMNIKYTKDENKIVYTTAALGIVLDKKTNKQRYFTNHEEDIVSLCIHPNKYMRLN